MSKPRQRMAIKIPVSACEPCGAAYETLPGGRDCPACGSRCIQAVVILPRERATITEAHATLLDALAKMRELAATS